MIAGSYIVWKLLERALDTSSYRWMWFWKWQYIYSWRSLAWSSKRTVATPHSLGMWSVLLHLRGEDSISKVCLSWKSLRFHIHSLFLLENLANWLSTGNHWHALGYFYFCSVKAVHCVPRLILTLKRSQAYSFQFVSSWMSLDAAPSRFQFLLLYCKDCLRCNKQRSSSSLKLSPLVFKALKEYFNDICTTTVPDKLLIEPGGQIRISSNWIKLQWPVASYKGRQLLVPPIPCQWQLVLLYDIPTYRSIVLLTTCVP